MGRTAAVIFAVIAVMSVISGVIFLSQSRDAQNKAAELEKSLNKTEKDLIYYQNTDLAKEVELLNLKLDNTKQDLAASQNEAAAARIRVETLEANHAKIPAYLSAVDGIQDLMSNGPDAQKLSVIDRKIRALNDQQMTSRWDSSGRSSIDLEHMSWGNGIYEIAKALIARVGELVK